MPARTPTPRLAAVPRGEVAHAPQRLAPSGEARREARRELARDLAQRHAARHALEHEAVDLTVGREVRHVALGLALQALRRHGLAEEGGLAEVHRLCALARAFPAPHVFVG